MTLLALIGAALVGSVTTAAGTALIWRTETARVARSRAEMSRQWRLLADIWAALDPHQRAAVRLNWQQKAALYVASFKAECFATSDSEGSTT